MNHSSARTSTIKSGSAHDSLNSHAPRCCTEHYAFEEGGGGGGGRSEAAAVIFCMIITSYPFHSSSVYVPSSASAHHNFTVWPCNFEKLLSLCEIFALENTDSVSGPADHAK
jgi:hypothetical protein